MLSIISISIAAVLSAIPPIFIKKYVNEGETKYYYIIASLIASILIIYFYLDLCRKFDATNMYTIVKILSILIVLGISCVMLQEKISTKKIIGIIFGVVTLILLA